MKAFQVIPPVVRDIGNGLEIDNDFLISLKTYLEYFDKFTVACPVRSGDILGQGLDKCTPISELEFGKDRFEFIPLPLVYSLIDHLRALPSVRTVISAEIRKADCLIVTPYSLIGDWPSIAVQEALRQVQPYVIEADGVHDDINRKRFLSKTGWKRLIQKAVLYPMANLNHRFCLKNSSLGIFQGRDVYDAYAPYCLRALNSNHHIPVYQGDHIPREKLLSKVSSIDRGEAIRICYAGRAIDMKGPLDWVETLHQLHHRGVEFDAVWLGDGPMIDEMQKRIEELCVPNTKLAGFVSDRHAMLEQIQRAHIFMFCHNTLESARILGEALACGTPIIGFESSYPVGLVSDLGGGLFCKVHDVGALSEVIARLDANRSELAKLVFQAADTGSRFDRDTALRERALSVMEHAG